jgi:hypothetical protein
LERGLIERGAYLALEKISKTTYFSINGGGGLNKYLHLKGRLIREGSLFERALHR